MKDVLYCGELITMACDGWCDKAWGINTRPRLYYMESGECAPRVLAYDEEPMDHDDHVDVGDEALGLAPRDPGTYEGGHGKPSGIPPTDPERMNKWCARECERSIMVPRGSAIVLPDMVRPHPNVRDRR